MWPRISARVYDRVEPAAAVRRRGYRIEVGFVWRLVIAPCSPWPWVAWRVPGTALRRCGLTSLVAGVAAISGTGSGRVASRPRSPLWPGGTAPGRKRACPGPPGAAARTARRRTGRTVRVLGAALALAGLTGAGVPGSVPASACAGRIQAPDPSGFGNSLNGVAVLSSCSAWAVGGYSIGSTDQSLIVHWNGTRWRQVHSPNPGGPAGPNVLDGVAALSASSAWAVGEYFNGASNQTLIVHWNGTRWRRVPSPNPGGPAQFNALYSVAALSARNIWAVGTYDQGITSHTLIVHWNGLRWRRVLSPDPGSRARLLGVAILSRAGALAVGYYNDGTAFQTLVVRWDGTRWRRVHSPDPGGPAHDNFLFGVAAASAGSVWAVGQYNNGTLFKTLAVRCC
jgi:hypothetical protein